MADAPWLGEMTAEHETLRMIREAMLAAPPLELVSHEAATIMAMMTTRIAAGLAAAVQLMREPAEKLPDGWRATDWYNETGDHISLHPENGKFYLQPKSDWIWPDGYSSLAEAAAAIERARSR